MPAIASAAAVSSRTFYREFANKEEAFLAAFDALADRAFGTRLARLAWTKAGPSRSRAHRTPRASSPPPIHFARLAFFELAAARPFGFDHADRSTERIMTLLTPAALPDRIWPLPEVIVEAIGGEIRTVIQLEIKAGHSASLPKHGAELTNFALAPFWVAGSATSARNRHEINQGLCSYTSVSFSLAHQGVDAVVGRGLGRFIFLRGADPVDDDRPVGAAGRV